MQRALALEWPADPKVRSIADQFMWGDAFLIAPVVHQSDNANQSRAVLLPAGGAPWTCFWKGLVKPAGILQAAAPIEHSPVFVRAGSIVPMGPFMQYTGEIPADPLEVRVYTGADGSFSLYEDDGKSAAPCAHSIIQMNWSHSDGTLTVMARSGSFPGMLTSRTLHIVFVAANHGVGVGLVTNPDITATYTGVQIVCSKSLLHCA